MTQAATVGARILHFGGTGGVSESPGGNLVPSSSGPGGASVPISASGTSQVIGSPMGGQGQVQASASTSGAAGSSSSTGAGEEAESSVPAKKQVSLLSMLSGLQPSPVC